MNKAIVIAHSGDDANEFPYPELLDMMISSTNHNKQK